MKTVRFVVALILVGLLWPAGGSAVLAAEIETANIGAVTEFPSGITFSVTARSSSPIVKAELLYTKAELETLNLVVADFNSGTDVEISLPVDLQNNYVPAGLDLTYRWRLTNDAGTVIETDPRSVTWTDTRFDWKNVTSEQVTVFYYTGNEGFARYILDSAQSTIDRLQSDFSVARSRTIRIWVYDSKSDFQGSQAPNSQEWIAGTAYPEMRIILAVLPDGNEREVGRVVPHEISHQVLFQATRNPFNAPSTWLDEGLAVIAQANGNESFQAMVERAAEDGRLFSIRSLTSEFPYDPADASLAYAESYSVVRFIIDRWGNEGVAALISAYKQGLSHDDVLRQALGVDATELDRLWKEQLEYQGDNGVAGQTSDPITGGWTERLIIEALSILLVLSALIAGTVMLVQRARGSGFSELDQMIAVRV